MPEKTPEKSGENTGESKSATVNFLFQDDHVIAINKPSGWDVHRNIHTRSRPVVLETIRKLAGRHVFPVHRLDGATSGVLLFARNKMMQKNLNHQFQERQVRKVYHAIVRGFLVDAVCTDPLEVEGRTLAAETSFKCLARIELPWPNKRYSTSRYSYVESVPVTGRFHQIRRHLNHLGWPIIGDAMHGDGFHNRLWRDRFDVHRLLLHASSLEFLHPEVGSIKICAPLPEDFSRIQSMPGWSTVV